MKIGSLFSGFGGLDMAVQSVIGGTVAWHVEFDDAPSKILAHHWPDVPNYGDITAVDWSQVEPVDVLTGGFPCQDVSLAGARAGLTDGTRSGLWSEFAKAISVLRPRLVVIENVRGLLSAKTIEETNETDSDMEPHAGSVGEPEWGDRPVLNAFGRVLGDLAVLGYDAKWVGLRAADAGASHGRYRVFILAYPQSERRGILDGFNVGAPCGEINTPGHESNVGGGTVGTQAPPVAYPNAAGFGRGAWGAESARVEGRLDDSIRDSLTTADTSSDEPERWGIADHMGSTPATGAGAEEERERIRHTVSDRSSTAANPSRIRGHESDHTTRFSTESVDRASVADERSPRPGATEWGVYEPAIRRWEQVLGRTAPSPTNPDGKNGSHRLSAEFVEWMQGLPVGHVTDPVIGLTRNQQLKALGNGVVPQQAALALRILGVSS